MLTDLILKQLQLEKPSGLFLLKLAKKFTILLDLITWIYDPKHNGAWHRVAALVNLKKKISKKN